MSFFSFSLLDKSFHYLSQKINSKITYYSKDITLWKKLNNKNSKIKLISIKHEKRINYIHSLPFFDDFSSNEKRDLLWLDDNIFINNTYCISPPNYGVATFDGLDSVGLPYDNSILNLSVTV